MRLEFATHTQFALGPSLESNKTRVLKYCHPFARHRPDIRTGTNAPSGLRRCMSKEAFQPRRVSRVPFVVSTASTTKRSNLLCSISNLQPNMQVQEIYIYIKN